MTSFVPISAVTSVAEEDALTSHRITSLPIVVIAPHNRCNCRCVMCDIWKRQTNEEISESTFRRLLDSFAKLNVQWVVFTGGEPQLNRNLFLLCELLHAVQIRVTLLTAGLLLAKDAQQIAHHVDELIVSLDGPAELHDRIRGVGKAFSRLKQGIAAVGKFNPEMRVLARCTIQKENRLALRATVDAARGLGLRSISFLAVDVHSPAFEHAPESGTRLSEQVALNGAEVDELETEIEALIQSNERDIQSGFIVETSTKLRRIVRHFRAHLGEIEPVSPPCNAPWHSAVIDANGEVRPCFFHAPYGSIREASLPDILNDSPALRFRSSLNIPQNETCRRCVCSLRWQGNLASKIG